MDPLTRLPNRVRFMERSRSSSPSRRRYERKLAVVHLDLDGFKFVNDNWGHSVGDRLLQSLALRLTRGVREVDTIARIGGDEFLVLVPDLRQGEDMTRFAQKLLALANRPVEIDGQHAAGHGERRGRDRSRTTAQDAETLLRNADAAMYRAKDLGGNNFELCTPELTAMAVERLELQNGLRLALDRNELVLHYQPLVSLGSGRIVGLEALVRWQHPQKGFVPPVTFIPVAEETGLILPLGDWVLRAATQPAQGLARDGHRPADVGQLLGPAVPGAQPRPHGRAGALRRGPRARATSRSRSPSRSRWKARRSSWPT